MAGDTRVCSESQGLGECNWGTEYINGRSSIGRAADSKSAGWGFDSLLACHLGRRIPAGAAAKRSSGTATVQLKGYKKQT